MRGEGIMKYIIKENQRGLLFKNGRFVEYLKPGKHVYRGKNTYVLSMDVGAEFKVEDFDLEVFLQNKELAKDLVTVDVADETLVIHFANDRYKGTLTSGRYAFFNIYDKHEFQVVDMHEIEVKDDIPRYLFIVIPQYLFTKIEVLDYQKARLTYDGTFVKLLEPGTYYFWNNGTKIDAGFVDTRLLQMYIGGQEVMTLDKVGLRINFVCSYRIADYVRIHTEIDDYESHIHAQLQLALRDYIGRYRLDEILENKEQLSKAMLERLKEKEDECFVTFSDAGVRDIILPGDIREIMNTVLLAEKKAQANVITRREEVASTRSLLNTARLMDENQTLYKLKELEYLEKICDNVGNISVNGGTDLLAQLTNILKGTSKE